jgi:hypothetical protein
LRTWIGNKQVLMTETVEVCRKKSCEGIPMTSSPLVIRLLYSHWSVSSEYSLCLGLMLGLIYYEKLKYAT